MEETKVFLTKEGLKKLQDELDELVNTKRPDLVEKLQYTRSQGDLSENSGYTQLKEDLAFADGRIEELEDILSRASVVDDGHINCSEVNIGCKVTVKNSEDPKVFHLVGEWEADPANLKISHQSPLGQALIGKKVGDTVEFEAPAGKILYNILKIE